MTFYKTAHEAIQAEIEENQCNDFTAFDGDDGCEECEGWDMMSNRCDCGNRRVSWAADYINPNEWYAFAQAH